MIDGVVQEIDIKTGKVLFQWNSADHVPYSQSEQPLPASPSTPWDWFHINAVKLDTDGNLLIDARDTWTSYKVDRHSGKIIWQLGGKASANNFNITAAPGQVLNKAGVITAWQHDFESQGNGIYTFFDNESAGVANTGVDATAEFGLSRAVTVKLDPRTHTATLIKSFNQPEGLTAPSQGNQPADRRRQHRRRLGLTPLLLGVRPRRAAALQRPVPDRRQQLPRLPAPLEPGRR